MSHCSMIIFPLLSGWIRRLLESFGEDSSTLSQLEPSLRTLGACTFHTFVQSRSTDHVLFQTCTYKRGMSWTLFPALRMATSACLLARVCYFLHFKPKWLTNNWVFLLSLGSLFPPVSIQALLWRRQILLGAFSLENSFFKRCTLLTQSHFQGKHKFCSLHNCRYIIVFNGLNIQVLLLFSRPVVVQLSLWPPWTAPLHASTPVLHHLQSLQKLMFIASVILCPVISASDSSNK